MSSELSQDEIDQLLMAIQTGSEENEETYPELQAKRRSDNPIDVGKIFGYEGPVGPQGPPGPPGIDSEYTKRITDMVDTMLKKNLELQARVKILEEELSQLRETTKKDIKRLQKLILEYDLPED